MKFLCTSLLIFLLTSCASYKPILDQNEKFFASDGAEREKDIDSCKKESDEYLDKLKAERAAREAGRKAVIGGVVGAAVGALSGRNLKSSLIGSAIGAGAGAIIGGLSVAGEDKVKPDVIKQRYIGNCLARKGYSVIGWY
ncbi:MAG: cell envelope biogenesis protein OmpA [Proteobacteria bacterium]|nr:cell envelope biogenesis protein OmpA [Pseudomonadota bacterium]